MDLVLTSEQAELRAAVRDLLTDHADSAKVRKAMDGDTGYDADLWRRLGTDLGVLGLAVPEELGGAGAGHVERSVLAAELGRALVPSPFLASAVFALDTLLALPAQPARDELVPALASGERIATLAVAEDGSGVFDPGAAATRATRSGDGWTLDGRKTPVLSGEAADVLVVHAVTDDGPALFLVDGTAEGLTRTRLASIDPTRRLARIDLAGTPATRLDGDAAAALSAAGDRGAVALAAEQTAGIRRAMELTVEYAKVRVQFGRPIGSYQAVKHGCADMYAAWEQSESAVRYAAWAADHDADALPLAAAVAAVYVGPRYFEVATGMVQYHGGVGYTWEHDAHLFYKRAKSDELLLGTPGAQRAHLADLLNI
ncbi:alkylation response protein AidB-like acyl-CoA dehydrogenase [Pseudonocardia sediminis]|uniref:Alkylation response protein AidB-like acyl-CoA dehydrogenase n=1 Tax=Pseudonocardia sediminis TaxID=1397368 RepID=A0A4Q7V249_PSEST|nr:acyl-CoA dehydrogenase family protein [Pseudonocardia sediminis]RZT86649.1 alkylation response protein AidB-like acyl-CoA dehydrogenase [Pseudonocardia sediminis]